MADKRTYLNRKPTTCESDPELKEVYSGLNQDELALIDSVSSSVNLKIGSVVGKAPFFYRYFPHIGLAFIMVIALSVYLTWPESPLVSETTSEKSDPTSSLEEKHSNPANSFEHSLIESESSESVQSSLKETDQAKSHTELSESSIKTGIAENSASTENIQNREPEKSTDPVVQTTNVPAKEDNTRKMAEEDNKLIFLRVASASVMSKSDLASLSSTSSKNTDVTNPQIGGKTITKTSSNDYSLEDLPYHKGGDQGLSSYISRNLSNKIYIRKNQAVMSVNVSFEVSAKGKVENVQILDDVPPAMEKEISQVISNDTEWYPGKKSGKKGAIQVIVNISFY